MNEDEYAEMILFTHCLLNTPEEIEKVTDKQWNEISGTCWIILLRKYPHLQEKVDWIKFTEEHWDMLKMQVPSLKWFINEYKEHYLMMQEME